MHPGRDAGEDVRFTLVGGGEALDDDGLRRLYAYPDAADPDPPARHVLRGNAITSLDGGATTGGTSGGLGGAGDRRLFAVLRELTDVIVVGPAPPGRGLPRRAVQRRRAPAPPAARPERGSAHRPGDPLRGART